MKSKITVSDNDLITLIQLGDQGAFAEIYNRYSSLLYLHARRMLGNRDDARDVVGDKAFIKTVTTFYYKEIKTNLNYDEQVTGYQTVNISNTQTVDNPNRNVNVVLAKVAGIDLTKISIRLNTDAQRVEAINGAPTPGLIGDFSKGPYTYRFYSADGTVRDWTVSFSIVP